MGVLKLLDADVTTVLFDLHDPTGAAAGWTALGSSHRREKCDHGWGADFLR
jgi:hypothetical protein